MGEKQREELMSSLNWLYTDGKYSDLTITCRDKHYRVHKAIVCPRSKFSTTSGAADEVIIDLPDDDPMAVEMAVHYLYHLDYSPTSIYLDDKATGLNGYANGTQLESEYQWKVNGHDGQISDDIIPDAVPEPVEGTIPEHIEDTVPEHIEGTVPEPIEGTVSVEAKKERKKKKKRKTSVQSPSEEPTTELKDSHIEEMGMTDEPTAEEAAVAPSVESTTYSNVLIHAKVYTLSKKYGVAGLKALALEKFQDEAKQNWATEDFLKATKEVYTSNLDEDDRLMRDVITGTLYEHPELLDKEETQKVIKGLELGFDLLMRVCVKGGFGDV